MNDKNTNKNAKLNLNRIEGFNPELELNEIKILDEYGNVVEKRYYLPLATKETWVWLRYPEGAIRTKTLQVTEKTGQLVAIMDVNNENDLMIINKSGITIRTSVDQIPVQGRATQGVRVINLGKKNDCIGSVCKVTREAEEELPVEGAQVEGAETTPEENGND